MDTPISFNTRFIEIETGEYPLTFQAIKAKHPLTSFAAEPTAGQLDGMGYAVVNPVEMPVGDVVTEGEPLLKEDGSYEQVFVVRAFTEEELALRLKMSQAELMTKLRVLRDEALEKGAPFDFGGNFGVQHVQLRDGDRANVIGLRFKAEALLDAGSSDLMGVRTFENVRVPLTAGQFMDLSWKYMAAFEAVMDNSWHYEDLIKASDSIVELPALPESLTPDTQGLAAA